MWNAWNTEPTVPSTKETKFLFELVRVGLDDKAYYIQTYDTPLGKRWIEALKDNLKQKRILEKNFCFLGFADSKRDLPHLVRELNKSVEQINSFTFNPAYEKIHPFYYIGILRNYKALHGKYQITTNKQMQTRNMLSGS